MLAFHDLFHGILSARFIPRFRAAHFVEYEGHLAAAVNDFWNQQGPHPANGTGIPYTQLANNVWELVANNATILQNYAANLPTRCMLL
eukprot:14338806-Heterocapsa_arctica.AAC.1